jgi:hypothetical protein
MKEECLPAKMGMSDVLWLISNFYDVQQQKFPLASVRQTRNTLCGEFERDEGSAGNGATLR